MARPGPARTKEVEPAARKATAAAKAPAPTTGAAAPGPATRLPSPPVAAAILAGAEKTERVHPNTAGRKPPAAKVRSIADRPMERAPTPPVARPQPPPRNDRAAVTIIPDRATPALPRPPMAAPAAMTSARPAPAVALPLPPSPVAPLAAAAPQAGAPSGVGEAAEAPAPAAKAPSAPAAAPQTAAGAKPEEAKAGEREAKAPAGEEGAAPAGAPVAGPAGPAVQLHMPEPPSGPSPATMKRIQGVQARASGKAAAHGALPSGAAQAGDARQAVTPPDAEATAKAQAALIAQVQAAPSQEIVELCKRIKKVINEKRPVDEDALMAAKPEGEALDAGNQLNSTVEGETKKVQDNYGSVNQPPAAAAPAKGEELPPQPAAAGTPAVNAKAATPDAVPAGNVSLDQDAADSKKKAQDAGMDTPAAQLVKSGPVADARAAQGELDQAAKEDPAKVLATQKAALGKAEGDMAALQAQALAALTTSRDSTVKCNTSRQQGMVGSEESMRAKASAEAKKTFDDAKAQVNALLQPLAANAMAEWEAAKDVLVTKFKADLAIVQERVKERHSGVGGFFTGLWDAVTGLPGWATKAYDYAEKHFGDGVINKLTTISTNVNAVIAACDLIIKNARDRITKIFAELPESLRGWAAQEQAKFDGQLDQLHNEVIAARDSFNKDLMERSSAAVNEVRAEIAELRKKAGGLIGRIVSAINRFIEDPVKFIIEGLLEILGIPPAAFWAVVAKIKKVVKDIADDPMKFANNLLKGLGEGFGKFFDAFGTHLLKGFLSWLLGGLKDVQIPKDVSVKSIVTFFLQLMGITWPNIRKILVKLIGAKNVALIEKVYSLVSLLIEKGPEGIYEMIKDKLDPQSIVDQVIDLAVDFMVSAIIKQVTARIIALFNPAGAIVQALEAIYRVLKWIFQNAAKIFSLVETVVNGVADILAGNTSGFAAAVERGLAMLIAPVIAFIADYLSLGDLPAIVADKIKSMREWILGLVEKALTWIVEKGKALLAAVGIGGKKEKEKDGKFDGQIGKTVSWTEEHKSHKLWIEESGSRVAVRMASMETDVATQLDEYEAKAKDFPEEKQKDILAKITTARGLLINTDKEANEIKQEASAAEKPADLAAKDDEVESTEQQLAQAIREVQTALNVNPEQVKKDFAAEVRKLPRLLDSPEQLSSALLEIYSRYEPRGLKRAFGKSAGHGIDILAEASAAEFADHIVGFTKDGAGGCSILIQIDGEVIMDGEIGLVVWNQGYGGAHAEARLLNNIHLLKRHLKRNSDLIEIWIRYSPCEDECSVVLTRIEEEIHKTHQLVRFKWYYEDLWICRGHTREVALRVLNNYAKGGIVIMSRAEALAEESIGKK